MNEPDQEFDSHEGPQPESSPAWSEFVAKYPDYSVIDTLYSLPSGLIDAIQDEIPDFFNEQEEEFERDLAEAPGAGFFLSSPFDYPPLQLKPIAEELDETTIQLEESSQTIRELLVSEMAAAGQSAEAIESYFQAELDFKDAAEKRQWGYAGWLVTSVEFHQAKNQFLKQWGAAVREWGAWPAMPVSFSGKSEFSTTPSDREFRVDYLQFYKSWCLDRMVTWELPVPLRPELVNPSLYMLDQMSEAGLVLFVPWHLLRDKQFNLSDVAEIRRKMINPQHLNAWLEGQPKNWGYERLTVMLKIYVYLELCLRDRYGPRLVGNAEKLDYALASFLYEDSLNSDSTRKIRQEMNRRLRAVD